MENQQCQRKHFVDFIHQEVKLEEERSSQEENRNSSSSSSDNQKVCILKKCSIKTDSSAFEKEESELKQSQTMSKQQIKLSSVQSLEKASQCKVKSEKGKFPTSFSLIKIPPKKQKITLKELREFKFSVLSYSIEQLIGFSADIIYLTNYAQQNYQKHQIEELILSIAVNYNKVAYHNFSHAFSLMLLNFQCLEIMPSFKEQFTSEQLFYTLIAGLSHDLNHNGTNNMYEAKLKSSLATLYNNQSVLQHMHISTLWKILRQNPSLNFLSIAKNQNFAKQIIVQLILGTDMSFHFKSLQKMQQKRKENPYKLDIQEDRMFLMKQLFHACDLGNPTLDYDSYISWAALLSHQFNEQAKLEKFYHLQVTKGFQYNNLSTLYNDQVWFVGKIVHPLWKELTLHLPKLEILKNKIEENTEILNKKLNEEELKGRV